jgi:peroxiredoxin
MLALALVALLGGKAEAQTPAPLAVGTPAPDFALAGATMDGVLGKPLRLSDFRDQTVVIAFFYKARTSG